MRGKDVQQAVPLLLLQQNAWYAEMVSHLLKMAEGGLYRNAEAQPPLQVKCKISRPGEVRTGENERCTQEM
jgi:hypothetical protein